MNIFAISDLHLSLCGAKPMDIFGETWDNYLEKIEKDWREKVTEDDLVLLAGDHSWAMKLEDAIFDLKFIENLSGTKIITKGNHDYWWDSYSMLKQALPKNIIALQNNATKFGNFVICGTRGWTVPEPNAVVAEHDKKIYDRELIRLELSLKSALTLKQDGDKLIVMIHYPPFNSKIEDSDFTNLMEKYYVDKVVYGHLHGKKTRVKDKIFKNGIEYILTSCDLIGNKLVKVY